MKTALILVLSMDQGYYRSLAYAGKSTWDSVPQEGLETVFCFGDEGLTTKPEYDESKKNLFTGTGEGLTAIGYKNIAAFEWALKNKQFDYIIRVNASTYVNKRLVHEFIQDLPDENLYMGVGAPYMYQEQEFFFAWGPCYVLSRDVVEDIVKNKNMWNHGMMDDVALGWLMNDLDVTLNNKGSLASIDIAQYSNPERYFVISYNCGGIGGQFDSIADIAKLKLPFIRVKTDWDRSKDLELMNSLFKEIEK